MSEEPLPMTRAALIEAALEAHYEDRGRLVAAEVVEAAADLGHPLHDMFQWDDSEAAARWRVYQAAQLIRSVKITVISSRGEGDDFKIRSWVPSRSAIGAGVPGYLPEAQVRADPLQRERVLRQMLREVNALRRRYRHLSEFWSAIAELGESDQEAG